MDQKTDHPIQRTALDRPQTETRPEAPGTRPETPQQRPPGEPTGAPPKRRRPWWLLILLVVLGAGVGFYWYTRPVTEAPEQTSHKRGSNPAEAPQPVGVAAVVTGDMPVTFDALGTVTSLQTVTIISQIAGYMQSVNFTEGQFVKRGDLLAQIDPRQFEISERQFESQLEHDQAALDQAKMDLARFQALVKKDSIATQTAEDQVYIVKQAEGQVKLDQAQIDAQKLNLIYCRITSPVTGRIGLRLVDPGNYVQSSNTTGIAIATQLDPISVVFVVPEDLLPSIISEFNAGHELSTVAYDRANAEELATGHLYALDSTINTSTGTLNLKASFANPDNKLFPNQFVNIRLLIKTLKNVTIAPNAAIQRGAPGTYVYVVDGDKVAVRKVTVGRIEGDKALITAGLAAGDQVVIDGTDRLRDGTHVTIPAASSTPNSPPDAGSKPAGHKGNHNSTP
jgi:membrane fusion protein, multidrug efflux system